MNVKKLLIALMAAALVVPAAAIATDDNPLKGTTVPETVVEGHTVYAVIEDVHTNGTDDDKGPAAAVAVLAQDVYYDFVSAQADNVLWFDDSFLHEDTGASGFAYEAKAKCKGSIWAVDAGVPLNPETPVENYAITDPDGITWVVTKYTNNVTGLDLGQTFAWGVNVAGTETSTTSGRLGCYYVDSTGPYTVGGTDPVENDPVNDTGPNLQRVEYNGLLWFFINDLREPGATVHSNSTAVDTYEGNSHPYNPDPDPVTPHAHQTRSIDLYWDRDPVTPAADTVFTNTKGGMHSHP